MSKAILPALAKAIAGWFPELGGRSIAVSDSDFITKENMPTLPLCAVALKGESTKHFVRTNKLTVIEDIIVQFCHKTERYQKEKGGETPYYAYYDYDAIRDALLTNVLDWKSPRNQRLEYVGVDTEADDFSVRLTFSFRHEFEWCAPETAADCIVQNMTFKLCPAEDETNPSN
ncbi:MAG: hypothetical protein ACRCYS_17045 [Beijerinckiaceae bacterium]